MSLLVLAALCAIPTLAFADSTDAVKKAVEANYTTMMNGFKKKDIKAVMSIYDEKYVGVGMDGSKMSKKQLRATMQGYIKDTKKVNSASYSVAKLKVTGDKASGITTFKLDAQIHDSTGMMGEKGKDHHMEMVDYQKVTWAKKGGKWLITSEAPGGQAPVMNVDGKPMGAPPAPTTSVKPGK
jgi:ketosteroid isomerase-like protein